MFSLTNTLTNQKPLNTFKIDIKNKSELSSG